MRKRNRCRSWSPAANICILPQVVISSFGECRNPDKCRFHKEIPRACNKCSRLIKRNGFAKAKGNKKSSIMIISDVPQCLEKIAHILKILNLNEDEIYFTHLIKCTPPEDKIPIPRPAEIGNCSRFIEKEIRDIGPDIIIALGHTVTKYFLEPYRAYPTKLSNGKILIPTVRPSSMKESNLRKLKTDYKKTIREIRRR